ncbi:filamentous hemagglutinin N-terminal domain-containing protein [Alcanivorax sp. IL3]|uniref:two-partner secretion domain-containing protein n=1 Tax=unclassified Alcanivorax TaxID=2638842 RepID=UPI0039C45E46
MPNSEPSSGPVSRVKSGLVYGLSLLLIWQPMLLSAQPITPIHGTNGRPTLDQAANGVPVVNIKNPNGKGVSQNFYNDLNVSDKGLVLNNSQKLTQTQLGGYIEGNPNLKNGSASLILNEVIGQNPSNLAGYIEVGGARADVVVANPNGISCNGCGFINTNHATLTTGQSIMEDGELRGFDVQGGAVSILGNGLNASNTERFDVIARSVTLAGELHADRLNIVTGQQQVDRDTLITSNATTDGDKPEFAIDSSALGGMYAGRIRLIANEDGVGVKLDAPVAAQNGDLQLSANGDLRFSNASAQGDIQLASAGDVISTGNVAAGGALAITADSVAFKGQQAGAKFVTITADHTRVGQDAAVLGTDSVQVTGDSLRNEGELAGKQVEIALDQGVVNDGQILAGEAIHLTSSTLNNNGTVQAVDDVSVEAVTGVTNEGTMVAGNAISVQSDGDVGNTGTILGGDSLEVSARGLNNHGQLHSGNKAALKADELSNTGSIVVAETLQATARVIDNQAESAPEAGEEGSEESGSEDGGLIQSGGVLSLKADNTLTNHARIVSGGDATLEAGEQLDNHGEITSQRNMTLSASQKLHNTGDVLALGSLIAQSETVLENHGTLQAMEHLSVSGDALTNDGAIRANGIVTLSAVAGELLNRSEVTAGQHVVIEANRFTNQSAGKVKAEGQLAVTADQAVINQGVLRAESALSLAGDTLTNHGEISSGGGLSIGQQDDPASTLLNMGLIASDGPALLSVEKVENAQGAALQSQGDMTLINADSLVNQGKVIGHGVLSLEAHTLLNERLADAPAGSHDGTLGGGEALFVQGNELVNRGGALLGSAGDMTLLIRDRVENNRSDIVAHRNLFIGAQLPQAPQEGEELTEQEALDALKTGEVINHSGQIITNTGEITIFTRHLDNSRQVELGKEYGITGADLKEAVLAALREDPDNALLKLIADNGEVNEEDWAFIMDPGVYTLRLYTAASSSRYDWVNHWVDVYSAYLNRQVSGTLSHNDIEAIRSRLLKEAGAINVQGARNPLAENFYLFARVSQLIKQRSPEKYDRLLARMESKLENKDGVLNVWQVACGGGRADWIGSSSKSCDNGYVRYYQFGKERYDDVIDPDSEAVASVISSAGDMRIHADALDNRFSTLSSGGNMHLSGDTLTNEALELKRHYEARWGAITWHNLKHEPDPGWRPWNYTHKKVVHAPLLDENGNRQVVSSVIAAGGDQGVVLDFSDEVGNYTKERADQTVEFDTREYEETPADDGGEGELPGEDPSYTDWGGSDVARAIDTINARTLALLDRHGSLFTVNQDANHPYLIETNPLFNTLDGFLGSEYLIDRLGLNPNGVSRRLGDSYYETQLIRDAILAATGTRFLDPDFNSDKDQFQWLMDNALVAAESMELAVGVSLSPEQINALQEDMVWMEEQTVAGHQVLVPVLYLAPGSQHLTNEGAVIAGNQVHITTDGLGNSGMIASNQGMVVNAGDKGVVNLEGTLQSGGQLLVDSLGDIKNQSGTLRGNGVVLQSQGDIIHEAWSERVEEQWHNGNHWRIDHRDAGVIDSTGDVVMNAGEHIRITGSRVSGETVGMQAGGNIEIGSLTTGSGFKGEANGGNYQYRQVRQLGSEIEATLNVLATAGNSIGITASTLNAGGNIGLTAMQGDILIQAAANEDYDHYHAKSSDEERTRTNHTVRQQQSALNAGGA